MEAIPDTTFEESNRMYQEIEVLREREAQWKQERENFLQREEWWLDQWKQREMVFQTRQLYLMNETQKHAGPLRHMYEQLQQDFESYQRESKEREEVLMKLLQSDKHHLIVEIPAYSFEDRDSLTTLVNKQDQATQTNEVSEPSCESKAAQITEEDQSANTVISGDNQVMFTFGDIPEELQVRKDPSVAVVEMVPPKTPNTKRIKQVSKKAKSTQQVVKSVDQAKEEVFAEKWEEREKAWEKQWSEAQLDNKNMFSIWKSLYEQRIQELESAAEESKQREDTLSKMLQDYSTIAAASDASSLNENKGVQQSEEKNTPDQPRLETEMLQTTEEVKPDESSNSVLPGDNDQVMFTFGDIPEEFQLWKDPSLTVVKMVSPKTPATKVRKPKKTQSTDLAVEDIVQAKEKWFAEKWEEREKAWDKQWSEVKSDHKNICDILKSLYERRIQELETAAQQSNRSEEHLSKI